jgi:hypothetical protein
MVYEVDQLPTLPSGTPVNNTAHIYFDFNPDVITNTVSNTVVNSVPGCSTSHVEEHNRETDVRVYPNPAADRITVLTMGKAGKIVVTDVYGRPVKTIVPGSASTDIDLKNLENGVYFVSVTGQGIRSTVKIVKQ